MGQRRLHLAAGRGPRAGFLLALFALAVIFLPVPGAEAASSCGRVSVNTAHGSKTKKVAVWSVSCAKARSLSRAWVRQYPGLNDYETRGFRGYLCTTAPAYTVCGQGSVKRVWIVNYLDMPIGGLHPLPSVRLASTRWAGCGFVVGEIETGGVALYRLKASGVSCGKARAVGKRWRKNVWRDRCEYTRCRARGFLCKARDRTEYSYSVRCKRGYRQVYWVISLY